MRPRAVGRLQHLKVALRAAQHGVGAVAADVEQKLPPLGVHHVLGDLVVDAGLVKQTGHGLQSFAVGRGVPRFANGNAALHVRHRKHAVAVVDGRKVANAVQALFDAVGLADDLPAVDAVHQRKENGVFPHVVLEVGDGLRQRVILDRHNDEVGPGRSPLPGRSRNSRNARR